MLDLIDNHSQAMNMQRESFNNIMVRVQLLEKAQARRETNLDPLSKSAPRKPDLNAAISRNLSAKHQTEESTDASLARALPKSLEPRKDSLSRRGAQSLPRGASVSKQSPLQLKAQVTDSDLALYDVAPAMNSRKNQIRANLYNYGATTPQS